MEKQKGRKENRAVTGRCLVCGLEVVGVLREGKIYPDSHARPSLDQKVIDITCMMHSS